MINQDSQLKLQAYLDGELPAREAAETKDWLARDAEAQALLAELRNTNSALADHEAECRLPESREFFWSKIEREIERQNQPAATAPTLPWLVWLQRHFLPVSGVALLSCLLGVMILRSERVGAPIGEMELASEDMGSYTFRDPQQKMTMVWLYDKSDDSQFTQAHDLASVEPE